MTCAYGSNHKEPGEMDELRVRLDEVSIRRTLQYLCITDNPPAAALLAHTDAPLAHQPAIHHYATLLRFSDPRRRKTAARGVTTSVGYKLGYYMFADVILAFLCVGWDARIRQIFLRPIQIPGPVYDIRQHSPSTAVTLKFAVFMISNSFPCAWRCGDG